MKKFVSAFIFVLATSIAMAQQKVTDLDKSPLDISYYPPNYPILKMSGKTSSAPLARIIYSRPQKKGRNIFGGEVKYNDVWRIGANESSEIEFFKNVVFGNRKVPKGRYTMFCIPTEDKWSIILNKDNFTWGSFTYSSANDIARYEVPVQKNSEDVEALTMSFENNGRSKLVVMWDTSMVSIPISF